MEPQCFLCGKTVKELAEEELEGRHNIKEISITLSSELAFPYELCDTCDDFLRLIIPKILEAEGIIKFDEKADKYVTIK